MWDNKIIHVCSGLRISYNVIKSSNQQNNGLYFVGKYFWYFWNFNVNNSCYKCKCFDGSYFDMLMYLLHMNVYVCYNVIFLSEP